MKMKLIENSNFIIVGTLRSENIVKLIQNERRARYNYSKTLFVPVRQIRRSVLSTSVVCKQQYNLQILADT